MSIWYIRGILDHPGNVHGYMLSEKFVKYKNKNRFQLSLKSELSSTANYRVLEQNNLQSMNTWKYMIELFISIKRQYFLSLTRSVDDHQFANMTPDMKAIS